MHTNVMLTYKR